MLLMLIWLAETSRLFQCRTLKHLFRWVSVLQNARCEGRWINRGLQWTKIAEICVNPCFLWKVSASAKYNFIWWENVFFSFSHLFYDCQRRYQYTQSLDLFLWTWKHSTMGWSPFIVKFCFLLLGEVCVEVLLKSPLSSVISNPVNCCKNLD